MPPPVGTSALAGTAYPLVLAGDGLEVLVVGGGDVAARKAESLLAAGARVRIVAPRLGERCRALAGSGDRAPIFVEREYRSADIGEALLVIAATDQREVNARVAADARLLRRLVNVADRPEEGNCITPATHRAGPLTIAVSAGGVPGAAARIRDAIAERFDERYGAVLAALVALRARLLHGGGRGQDGGAILDARWRDASEELLGRDFCEGVEDGSLTERLSRWD